MNTIKDLESCLKMFEDAEKNASVSHSGHFILKYPNNDWDTNYHLIDKKNGVEYLIDINDVCDTVDEQNCYGGILWDDMLNCNIAEIVENSWKEVSAC